MSMNERIKECRIKNGLSQAELAERLVVSRQAISKWESGKGTPDIMNLKNMANLFGVSVDYLLDDESQAGSGEPVIRQAMDVDSLEPSGGRFRFQQSKANTAVRTAFPTATIWPLTRQQKNTKSQEGLEWLNALLFDGPFNIFKTADGLSNRDSYYLVEDKARKLLVRVSSEAVEAREINVTGSKFTVGLDQFRTYRKPLA